MFYYLIHNLPWGSRLEPGKRNVRTFIIGTVCYIIFHALLYADKLNFTPMMSSVVYMIRRYFWWIVLADAVGMAIIYKLYYGRNILTELPIFGGLGGLFGGGGARDQPQQPHRQPLPQPQQPQRQPQQPQPQQPQQPQPQQSQQFGQQEDNESSDLNIDLLTENESDPDPQSQQQMQMYGQMQVEGFNEEDELDEDEVDEVDEVEYEEDDVEELEEFEDDESNGSSDPLAGARFETKLTSNNIDKYVNNRNKLKLQLKKPETEINSTDLDL
jgi:hypothetical protein